MPRGRGRGRGLARAARGEAPGGIADPGAGSDTRGLDVVAASGAESAVEETPILSHSSLDLQTPNLVYRYDCSCRAGIAPQSAVMLQCSQCAAWWHAACVKKALAAAGTRIWPGESGCEYVCARCVPPRGTFERQRKSWAEAVRDALYVSALQQRFGGVLDNAPRRRRGGEEALSVEEIVQILRAHFDSLCHGRKRASDATLEQLVQAALSENREGFFRRMGAAQWTLAPPPAEALERARAAALDAPGRQLSLVDRESELARYPVEDFFTMELFAALGEREQQQLLRLLPTHHNRMALLAQLMRPGSPLLRDAATYRRMLAAGDLDPQLAHLRQFKRERLCIELSEAAERCDPAEAELLRRVDQVFHQPTRTLTRVREVAATRWVEDMIQDLEDLIGERV